MNDVSPDFRPEDNAKEITLIQEIMKYEGTGEAVRKFAEISSQMTNYTYWFMLSTLWVSYSGHSDLNLWRRLFRSPRSRRQTSIMKPSELQKYNKLPATITAFRAHRIGETDWISYTLNPAIASRFAMERGVDKVTQYRIKKKDVLALFLRRGEEELIVLDPRKPKFIYELPVGESYE